MTFPHRELFIELFKREFAGRYRGSMGGVLWSLAEPVLMLSVYALAFGYFMELRWRPGGGAAEYVLMMFLGLIVFQAFAECLNKAPGLIVAHPNFVKKVVFPLALLPGVMVVSALSQCVIGLGLWLLAYAGVFGLPPVSVLWLPVLLLALLPSLLAVAWLLAGVGVLLRDLPHLCSLFARALLFMTPVFYSLTALPGWVQRVLLLNPLTFIIEQFRAVLFLGERPDFIGLLAYGLINGLACLVALRVFACLRPVFADHL